jgi:hypothetical protein
LISSSAALASAAEPAMSTVKPGIAEFRLQDAGKAVFILDQKTQR